MSPVYSPESNLIERPTGPTSHKKSSAPTPTPTPLGCARCTYEEQCEFVGPCSNCYYNTHNENDPINFRISDEATANVFIRIGNNIKKELDKAGKTPHELAVALEISDSQMEAILSGTRILSMGDLSLIAIALRSLTDPLESFPRFLKLVHPLLAYPEEEEKQEETQEEKTSLGQELIQSLIAEIEFLQSLKKKSPPPSSLT